MTIAESGTKRVIHNRAIAIMSFRMERFDCTVPIK